MYLVIYYSIEYSKEDEILVTREVQPGISIGEKLDIEIMSKDYIVNKKFLMRAKINDEQVGVVYFDKDGEIRFDGDREKFEYALCKAFKIREKEWKR